MDIKRIRALFAAVECGSLTAAAEELGYTQSGLTHMMNALEDELGVPLLMRGKNGVSFTQEAQELLPQMRALLQAAAELELSAAELCRKNYAKLQLGAYSSVARHWLPSVLSAYRGISPDTVVSMYVGGMEDIYEKLHKKQLDCAFVSYQPSLCRGLKYVPLRDDPLVAIMPGGYRGAGEVFSVAEFSGSEFIMPADGFEMDIIPVFGKAVEQVASSVQRINFDDAALVSMVEHHLGVTILSDLVMKGMNYDVRVLPLEPPAYRQLGIAMSEHAYNSKNIRRFVRCAQDVVDKLYADRA